MGKKDGSQMTSNMTMMTNTKSKQTTQAETLPLNGEQLQMPANIAQSTAAKTGGRSAGASPQTYSHMMQGNNTAGLAASTSNMAVQKA